MSTETSTMFSANAAKHRLNVSTHTEISVDPEWLAFLKARGAHEKDAQILDFGHPDEELAAVCKGALLAPLTHLAPIACTGEDAQSFLQNQTTNDVVRLPVDGVQHSAWCSPQGRMLASLILYRQEMGFRALLAADLCAVTLTGLRKYILRSKVRLDALSGSHVVLGLAGARTEEAVRAAGLALPAQTMRTSAGATATVIRIDSGQTPRCIIVAEKAAAPALFDALAEKARPAGISAWQCLDIQAGVVLITAAIRDAFVPQMLAFDKIGGVSFNKGCYPGQEIIARAHYLGKVKRSLYRLRSETPLAAGEAIYPADSLEACGTVAQAAPDPVTPEERSHIALAVIKDSAAQAAQSGAVSLTAAGAVLTALEALPGERQCGGA